MVIQIKSEWMIPRVETLKILNNLSDEKYNRKLESIQYTDKDQDKTLLIVANENGKPRVINLNIARTLNSLLDDTKFSEIFVFGETHTASAYALLRNNDKATISTSSMRTKLSTEEILEAFNQVSGSLCEIICDINPVEIKECKSTSKGANTCDVITLIDNAKFYSRMGWKDQLLQGFTHLIQYKQELLVKGLG